jgi:hypothetical protein
MAAAGERPAAFDGVAADAIADQRQALAARHDSTVEARGRGRLDRGDRRMPGHGKAGQQQHCQPNHDAHQEPPARSHIRLRRMPEGVIP